MKKMIAVLVFVAAVAMGATVTSPGKRAAGGARPAVALEVASCAAQPSEHERFVAAGLYDEESQRCVLPEATELLCRSLEPATEAPVVASSVDGAVPWLQSCKG